jgi:hypothetical protein
VGLAWGPLISRWNLGIVSRWDIGTISRWDLGVLVGGT